MKSIVLFLFLNIIYFGLSAQNQIGINPPGKEWQTFENEDGRYIFPAGLDSHALRVAFLINYLRSHDTSVLGSRITKKIPVILQNGSTLPAGFAIPAPWRAEDFLMPPQNRFLGPVTWLDVLTIHEYRHAQQFWMANKGFTRIYQVLMGQTGWLVNSLFTQPLWYREGDAVAAETGFTNAGRGSLPAFHMEYRAMLLNGIRYNYEKIAATFSYKDFTPNLYRTGYYMTLKARKDYGDDIWVEVQNDVFRKKGFFWAFSRSMKDITGYTSKQFYNETVEELDSLWRAEEENKDHNIGKTIAGPAGKYTSWRFPKYISDSLLVAERSSLDQIRTYYLISENGRQEKLFHPGQYTSDHVMLSYNGGLLTWAETRYHERWSGVDYSVVMKYDPATKKKKQLTRNSRYFSPSPSPDGKYVAVVEVDEQINSKILILNVENGHILKELANPGNKFYAQPNWIDHERLVIVAQNACGNWLEIVNISTGLREDITHCSSAIISRPVHREGYIFFDAGFSDVQNIYAVELSSENIYRITNSRFGAFDPDISPDGEKLAFSEYNYDGYSIMEIALDKNNWKLIDAPEKSGLYGTAYLDVHHQDITQKAFLDTPVIKKYNPFFRDLINVYGWFPLPNIVEYGAEFYALNLMRTLQGTVGVVYNINEEAIRSYGRISYAAFYPILELEYGLNDRNTNLTIPDTLDNGSMDSVWYEHTWSAGVRLPFNFSGGIYNTRLELGAKYQFIQPENTTDIYALAVNLNFSRLRLRARQQIHPRWGQDISLTYQQPLHGEGENILANATLYFPGFFRTHSLYWKGAYSEQDMDASYRFPDLFRYARGYRAQPFEKIWLQSVNYEFPIFYPDLALGSVIFWQRLRLNLYTDISSGELAGLTVTQRSVGGELMFDMVLFRLAFASLGLQYSYRTDVMKGSGHGFNFLFTTFQLL